MATAEQINRFFPKAAGVDEHASKVATVEIPATDLILTADGAPVLWVKAKRNEDGVNVCVYTTIGADFSFAVSESVGNGAKKRSNRVQNKSKQNARASNRSLPSILGLATSADEGEQIGDFMALLEKIHRLTLRSSNDSTAQGNAPGSPVIHESSPEWAQQRFAV